MQAGGWCSIGDSRTRQIMSDVFDSHVSQITSDVMTALREALRAMKDFSISCGVTGQTPEEVVLLHWATDDANFNVGLVSGVGSISHSTSMSTLPLSACHSTFIYNIEYQLNR